MTDALARISAVPVTPFHPDGTIDEPAVGAVARRIVDDGIGVVVPCGGTGEFSALTAAERERVARLTIDAVGGDALVLVGVGGDAQSAAAAARSSVAAGAAGVMVHALVDPYVTPDGTVAYVERVAGACDGLVVLYLRGRLPDWPTLERLVAVDGVVAVKWAVADLQAFALFAERLGDRVLPICGLAELWAPYFALAGGRGFTSGLVNVTARPSLELDAALRGGDWAGAMDAWRRIRPFEELRARHDAGNNVPAVKEAMALLGRIPSATVRPPLAPLSAADRDDLAAIVRDLGVA